MGKLIGSLGSAGMLAFIAMLFFAFLRHIGVFSEESAKRLKTACRVAIVPAIIYWLCAYLMYCVIYGSQVIEITDFQALFPINSLKNMVALLEAPTFHGLFSWLFAIVGHMIGKILFGKYMLGGMVLACLLVISSVYLILSRAEKIVGRRIASQWVTFLFALPGAFILFLPGWPPLAFFCLSVLSNLALSRMKPITVSYSDSAYSIILVFLSVLSAISPVHRTQQVHNKYIC